MHLFLAPEDVWLFRDGRPFDAASSHRARSLFPPYPSVLQGVIRSHQLIVYRKDVDLTKPTDVEGAVGTATKYGALAMHGPFVATYKDGKLTLFFPRPADWFPVSKDSNEIHALSPKPRNEIITSGDKDEKGNYALPQLFFPSDNFNPGKKEYGDWLTYEDLKTYLTGGMVVPVAGDQLFLRESRVGIQIKAGSRAVEQGMLYEAEFVRPLEDVGLYLEVEGYTGWSQTGMMKIGGEGHAACYEQLGEKMKVEWIEPPSPLPNRFKVYFATPAYFSNGWRPANWNDYFDGKVTLEAVALKGYDTVGGFDYAAHGDKASQRYVPAGSVYYFSNNGATKLTKALTETFESHDDIAKIGFGQVMVVEWK